MISSLVNLFTIRQNYIPTSLETEDDIDQLINQIASSQIKGHKLTCISDNKGGYTVTSRDVKWYEFITSLFWVSQEDDTAQTRSLLDGIIRKNQFRFFNEHASNFAINVLKNNVCSPETVKVLQDRVKLISNLSEKIPRYQRPEDPQVVTKTKVDFSKAHTQIQSALLSLVPELRDHILSYTKVEDIHRFKTVSKKGYGSAKRAFLQKSRTPVQVLKQYLENPSSFNPELIDGFTHLAFKDKMWIQSNSDQVRKLLYSPKISEKENRLEFFKQIAANLDNSDLEHILKKSQDEEIKNFAANLLHARIVLSKYASNTSTLAEVLKLDWKNLAPYLKMRSPLNASSQYNFLSHLKNENLRAQNIENEEFWLFVLRAQVNDSITRSILVGTDTHTFISHIPLSLLEKEDFAIKILEVNPHFITQLPKLIQNNRNVLLIYLSNFPSYFEDLEDLELDFRNDPKFILEAVKRHGRILKYLKDEEKTDDVVEAAITHTAEAYNFAPKQLRKWAVMAASNNGQIYRSLPNIYQQDREILEIAIKTYPEAICFSSDPLNSDIELLKLAVYQSDKIGKALGDLIFKTKNKALILMAIEKGLDHPDLNLKDSDIARAYLEYDIRRFDKIKDQMGNNPEPWLTALEMDPTCARDLPFTLQRDENFMNRAIDINPAIVIHAPWLISNDSSSWMKAIQRGLSISKATDYIKKDKSVVLEAVKYKGTDLQFASSNLRNDKEVVMRAIEQNWEALAFASPDLKNDEELVILAALQNEEALNFAGDQLKNNIPFKTFFTKLKLERKRTATSTI